MDGEFPTVGGIRCARRTGGFGLLALGLAAVGVVLFLAWLFEAGRLDYFVPHACGGLECLHDTARARDCTVHCAKFPPVDVKMAGGSGRAYRRTRIAGGVSLLLGLLLSAWTVRTGWHAFTGRATAASLRRVALEWAAPLAAFSFALLARAFLWPLGFFSF